jgi:hypothetical protein
MFSLDNMKNIINLDAQNLGSLILPVFEYCDRSIRRTNERIRQAQGFT